MATPTTQTKTLAFFGATGGCALACLVRSLEAGYTCNALARTPAKLTKLLADRGVPTSTLDASLHITPGDAKDVTAVTAALQSPGSTGSLVDVVVSGIGGTPTFQWSLKAPITATDPHVCAVSAQTLMAALAAAPATAKRPLVAAVSTTGISALGRDVPLLLVPLYHWLLAVVHMDKMEMEKALAEAPGEAVVARASLLMDGPASEGIRVGWEGLDGKSAAGGTPAVGYTISRESVGRWLFEELIKGDGGKWAGRAVTLTN